MTFLTRSLFFLSAFSLAADAYWLMGAENVLTTQRLDPIVDYGKIGRHVHSVLGGSNFGTLSTAVLRQSKCTSIPIPEDKSNYWYPHLYFQWANGSFSSLNGGAVIYYLFSNPAGNTTAFPDDFRMITGDPTLRTYDPNSFAQQAVTFLCLDFNGVSTRHNELPLKSCPSGVRAQINFPSCWNGKDVDSPDHKSHVSFLSQGPDSGSCNNPKYPVTLPRIFMEVYWGTGDFDAVKSHAMNPTQPFVFSYGDPTGYGYHADFVNGWDAGVLQRAVNECNCNNFGAPDCCVDRGIFHMNKGQSCRITPSVDEPVLGTLPKLPGNNPVQGEGARAALYQPTSTPAMISPVYVYTGAVPTQTGTIVSHGTDIPNAASPDEPSASHSTLPTSVAAHPSYQVLAAPSLPSDSDSDVVAQASVHPHHVSVSHRHDPLKHTPSHKSDSDPCDDNDDRHSSSEKSHHPASGPSHHHHSASHTSDSDPCDDNHHHSPEKHHHSHPAGELLAAEPTDNTETTYPPHHGPGSNGGAKRPKSCRKRGKGPRSVERRSTVHVARSLPGHRFMKYHARTFS